MSCRTDNMTRSIQYIFLTFNLNVGEYIGILRGMLLVPQTTVMNLNDVMTFIDICTIRIPLNLLFVFFNRGLEYCNNVGL